MSTSPPKSDGTARDGTQLEELAPPEEALTSEGAERIHGGAAITGTLTGVCRTPGPLGPTPIPYPD